MSKRRTESGQAAVEAAITLPLVLFLILGTLQLFMALQGRILAQYALGRAARMGSLRHGDCVVMRQTAVAALIPAIKPFARAGTNMAARYANIFGDLQSNGLRYDGGVTVLPNQKGEVIWLFRDAPAPGSIPPNIEETWNLPPPEGRDWMLELRMVFWFPLKIPFANWVVARAVLAHQGLQDFKGYNPMMPTREAVWTQDIGAFAPPTNIAAEFRNRVNGGSLVLPIVTTFRTRMMTPPRDAYFNGNCR